MEKLDGSGAGTSSHLSQTSTYIAVPLDTVQKDQKFLSYKGPTAFESSRKQITPSPRTSNVQILPHCQHNNESYLRQSTVLTHRPTGQIGNYGFTAVLPKDNYPQHKSQRSCSNDRPPEIAATAKKVLLRHCPVHSSSSSSFEHQKASSASKTTNRSQQSLTIVLNTNNLSESWQNNLYNQQQHVKTTKNLPKDSVCQGSFINVGVILSRGKAITFQTSMNKRKTNDEEMKKDKLHQQNACMPKDIYQQKYATQKAIAVVTPLTQKAVVGFTLSNLAKEKEGSPETRAIPNKNDHRPYIPHICQSTTNESGAKSISESTFQTKEVPSVLANEFPHCVKDDRPVKNNQLPGPSENLSPVSHNSVSVEKREVLQQSPTDYNCSANLLREYDATVMSRNPVGTKTTMDPRMDKLSTAPVQEWSLQRLCNFITQLEQMQRRQQKDVPYDDLFNEMLKLYWNGDYQKLCDAAKSNLYSDIMKEVRLHCQTENPVILQGVSRERLNEIASSFHILEHGSVPPKMGYRSSWLNLSENLYDIPSERYDLSSLMTLHCKQTKTPDKEAPVKEMENMSEPTNEKRKASNKPLSGRKKQRKTLTPEHQKNSERKEPVGVTVENTCSGKETEGQNGTDVKNMTVENSVQSEQQNQINQAPLLESLSTQASDVSDHCAKSRILLKLLTTDTITTPELDINDFADCVSDKKSILPPEKTGEPDVEANNMNNEDAPSLTDSSQVTVESLDQDKMCVDIKSDEMSNGIELEKYCCLPKWLQVLGYRNGGLCKCEKMSELSHQADASDKGVKEVNIEKNRYPFDKPCEFTGTDICELKEKRRRKKPSPVADDDSMDELEIVDVITNYEDVLKLANAMSEQATSHESTSHESTSGRDRNKEITTEEFKRRETLINLTLFGNLHAIQKKNTSGFLSSDKVHLPPETLNVRIGSGCNEQPNSAKSPKRSHTPKQQVWNTWKKTRVPSKISTNRVSKNQNPAKSPESKNDRSEAKYKRAFYLTSAKKQKNTNRDQSKKKSRKKISLTRQDQIRKLKRNNRLASFNLKKRWNYANHGRQLMKTSFDSTQVINARKNKLNTGLALNFGVLPESFNMSNGSSSEKANQPASAESNSKVKTVVQIKRTWSMSGTWSESPKKKQWPKSTPTLPNSSGISTFQEFKKKYEEKKQKIPLSY